LERLCQWLLQTAPEYRGQVRDVWLWDEWSGRWAADAGIDLVAETVGGELWAVQAKAYDPRPRDQEGRCRLVLE
jgi:predicted helicase